MDTQIDDESRESLAHRIDLVAAMIAEGKNSTARRGWIFVTWGLVYIVAIMWNWFLPQKEWAWPICIALGLVTIILGRARHRHLNNSESTQSRSIDAVWGWFGKAVLLYVIVAGASHHLQEPSYDAAILIFFGAAHAVSASILRWNLQKGVAILWFAGGAATFFVTPHTAVVIFLVATVLGLVCFGIYAMSIERRLSTGADYV